MNITIEPLDVNNWLKVCDLSVVHKSNDDRRAFSTSRYCRNSHALDNE